MRSNNYLSRINFKVKNHRHRGFFLKINEHDAGGSNLRVYIYIYIYIYIWFNERKASILKWIGPQGNLVSGCYFFFCFFFFFVLASTGVSDFRVVFRKRMVDLGVLLASIVVTLFIGLFLFLIPGFVSVYVLLVLIVFGLSRFFFVCICLQEGILCFCVCVNVCCFFSIIYSFPLNNVK